MRYLLDTHVFYQLLVEPKKINKKAISIIENNEIFVSIISPWELNIKQSTGKLKLPFIPENEIEKLYFKKLDIKLNHTKAITNLPLIHRDPFDRMLIAQASEEEMVLMTADEKILEYNIPTFTT